MENILSIEGNPFITRFKTAITLREGDAVVSGIEGNPFITRFKTTIFGRNGRFSFFSEY